MKILLFLYFIFGIIFFPYMLFHSEIIELYKLKFIFLPYFSGLSIFIVIYAIVLENYEYKN